MEKNNNHMATAVIMLAMMVCASIVILIMARDYNNMPDAYALEIEADNILLGAREAVIRYYGLDLEPDEVEITETLGISYNSNRATRQPDHSVDLAKTNDDISLAFALKNKAETIKSRERSYRWVFGGLTLVAAVCGIVAFVSIIRDQIL